MRRFREFFKTTAGMKPQSEGGQTKEADSVNGYATTAINSIKGAFGFGGSGAAAPTPPPPPANVSPDTGSLSGNIGAAISRKLGG